jgi:glycosyltransferase involved in cell wall biosynthesis
LNIVYITEKNGSAIKSQVFELLNELALNSEVKNIYLLLGTKDINESVDFKFNQKIEIHYFKNFGMYPMVDFLNIFELQKVLKRILVNENSIFHVRSEYISFLLYKAFISIYKNQKPKLYIDIRGAAKEEIEMSQLGKMRKLIKLLYFKNINEYLLNKNFKCNVVSKQLQKYISEKFNVDEISVIPCIAGKSFIFDESIRKKTRKILNLDDDERLLIFSSGASNSWQNYDEVVDLFSKTNKLIMLTQKTYSNKNVISKFVDFKDVPGYLAAADIGIILRGDSIVNKVASPIKFSEYIACGLPVITDGNVEQINEFILNTNYGHIDNTFEDLAKIIENLKSIDRDEISKLGIETYGLEKISDMYVREYRKISDRYESTS